MRLKSIFFFLFFFSLNTFLQAQTYKISGQVVCQNASISNAIISLNENQLALTSKSGKFIIDNIAAGKYTLKITHLEHQPYYLGIEIHQDTVLPILNIEKSVKDLEEVVVSTNKQHQARTQNHTNVQVVNADFIQKNLSGSLMQSLEKLPGVNAMSIGSAQSKPQIRGLGFNQIVVVDGGLKHEGQQWGADHGLEIDQFGVGNIEILKGAASYIYGSDAMGGIIKINHPNLPSFHTLKATLNSSFMTNSGAISNSLNVSGRKHKWYFDSRVTHRDYGDYKVPTDKIFVYDYAVNLNNGRVRNSAGKERNIQFTTGRISEKLQTRLHISNVFSESGFFANAHGLEPRNVNTTVHDQSNRDILLPSQKVNHFKVINNSTFNWGKHALSVDLGYQNNNRKELSEYIGHGFMPAVFPTDLNISPDLERAYKKDVFSANIRDEITLGKHQITFGGNYEHQSNKIGGWGFLIPSFNLNQGGLYAYDKLEISNQTKLHAALRFDVAKLNVDAYNDWFESENSESGENSFLNRVQQLTRNFSNWNGSLGINHSWKNFDFKANVGSSFRVPLAKELAASGVNYHYFRFEKGNAALSPEKSYQFDLGVFWKKESLEIELTPFFNYFPNYIYLNPTAKHDYLYGAGNQVFEYEQSEVMRYGAETHIKWNINDVFSTNLALEYLYNEQLSGAKKGFSLPFSPPPSGLWNLTYTPNKIKGAYLTFEAKHVLEQNRIVPPERITPAYTIFNLQAGSPIKVGKQSWTLGVQINNILNEKYLNHTSFYRLISLPEMGRNLTLNLKIPVNFAI